MQQRNSVVQLTFSFCNSHSREEDRSSTSPLRSCFLQKPCPGCPLQEGRAFTPTPNIIERQNGSGNDVSQLKKGASQILRSLVLAIAEDLTLGEPGKLNVLGGGGRWGGLSDGNLSICCQLTNGRSGKSLLFLPQFPCL